MELTSTDVVFNTIALVLFLCRKQILQTFRKSTGSSFGKYEKYPRQVPPEGVGQWATSPCSATTPLVAVGRLVGPTGTYRPQLQLYKFPFVPEKIKREVFVAFAIRSRRHHLFFIWRADLESVLGSGEGKSSPSSSSTFLHRQFYDALHRS